MKSPILKTKFLSTSLFVLISTISLAQHVENGSEIETSERHHCLFEENSISIAAAADYSFNLSTVGINTRVYYNLGEHICFGPEFSFLKKDEERVFDFNIVGHYIFETKLVGIFPLLGANYTIEKNEHESEEALGVVFGGGIHRNFNLITVFAEYSHIESRLRDDFVTVGLMINLN